MQSTLPKRGNESGDANGGAVMRLNLILFLVLILVALGVVTSQHEARKLYTKHERLTALAAQYKTEYEQLQIEQSTWAMHSRVERMATKQLQMMVPLPKEVQVIVLDKVGQ
jgi:cell division protein FtsL